jgi:hypothetical protein
MRLAFFPLTDLGNAERFRERYLDKLLWCPALGWLCWDGKRWSREGADDLVKIAEHDTVRAIQDEAGRCATAALQGRRRAARGPRSLGRQGQGHQILRQDRQSGAAARRRSTSSARCRSAARRISPSASTSSMPTR